ncbi:MAG: hypothetical protein N0E37_16805, partial [Candidatus Thiodiazotropha taylori]|nr:hypothetical protein [Candidatus Thiodiazotropha taylori]MCW4246098.1 hypothetical protein [Candidatus Thiodiazotropha taylori]
STLWSLVPSPVSSIVHFNVNSLDIRKTHRQVMTDILKILSLSDSSSPYQKTGKKRSVRALT